MILSFIAEYLWALLILLMLSAAGGFAVIPFYKRIPYLLLLAPLCGLLLLSLGISTLYSVCGLTVLSAAAIVLSGCAVLTCMSYVSLAEKPGKLDAGLLVYVFLLIAFITYITNYTTITLTVPGMLFIDGTDHLGYAHLADWLNTHTNQFYPITTNALPYASWPAFMFDKDPRFGSFFILAFIADVRGLSGMFAYDSACAVVLSAGILAVSAVFARSRLTLILLSVGLLLAHWFDYSRSGYFGKILGYPSALLLVGLFFNAARPFNVLTVIVLIALTTATTIMHSGYSTALFLGILLFPYVLLSVFQSRQRFYENLTVFALLIGIALATMGILARPNYFHPAMLDARWFDLLPRLFDYETLTNGPRLTTLTGHKLFLLFVAQLTVIAIFISISIKNKSSIALTFLLATLGLIFCLWWGDKKWQAYQLIGTFYPWFLCAGVWLIDDVKKLTKVSYVIVSLLLLTMVLHVPRLSGALHRYAGNGVAVMQQFSKKDMDNLSEKIGGQKVIADVTDPAFAIPILVELGRHGNLVAWTPAAWKTVVGYRSWPAPKIDQHKYRLWLAMRTAALKPGCAAVYSTEQYNLITCGTGRN